MTRHPIYPGAKVTVYDVEIVYVGTAGHLRRYKVTRDGRYVEGGLFRTMTEARAFIAALLEQTR